MSYGRRRVRQQLSLRLSDCRFQVYSGGAADGSRQRIGWRRSFIRAAARSGSFTEVAAQLGITKSAVAKAVTQLEGRLGVKLLHRTAFRLSLTPEGAGEGVVTMQAQLGPQQELQAIAFAIRLRWSDPASEQRLRRSPPSSHHPDQRPWHPRRE